MWHRHVVTHKVDVGRSDKRAGQQRVRRLAVERLLAVGGNCNVAVGRVSKQR